MRKKVRVFAFFEFFAEVRGFLVRVFGAQGCAPLRFFG